MGSEDYGARPSVGSDVAFSMLSTWLGKPEVPKACLVAR